MSVPGHLCHLTGGKGDQDEIWGRVAKQAAVQHGVISRRQLRDIGMSDRQVDVGLRRGLLHGVHRGVFALGHERLSPMARCSAAVLACGPGAALGYRSAGAAWALRPSSRLTVEVVVPARTRPRHRRVAVHCHPGMAADEVTVQDGIAMTTVARTLLDLAAVLSPDALRKAVGTAETLGLFDLHAVRRLLARHPRHAGRRALEDVLSSWTTPTRLRSGLESSFVALCRRHCFPAPLTNSTELGMEIDALFPDHGIAVELDGRSAHRGVVSREQDYARRALLTAAGWRFFAFTHRQVTEADGRFVVQTLGPSLEPGPSPSARGRGGPFVPTTERP